MYPQSVYFCQLWEKAMPIKGKISPFILLWLGRMNHTLISHFKKSHQISLPKGVERILRCQVTKDAAMTLTLTECGTLGKSLNSLVDIPDNSNILMTFYSLQRVFAKHYLIFFQEPYALERQG